MKKVEEKDVEKELEVFDKLIWYFYFFVISNINCYYYENAWSLLGLYTYMS